MRKGQREFMRRAIELAKQSKDEGGKPRPKVGALLVISEQEIKGAYRGETREGVHAEAALLEKIPKTTDLSQAILYTTLEPCTARTPPDEPCTQMILERGIPHVVIGMVDPNEVVRGNGIWALRQRGVNVELFDPDLMKQVEDLNSHFVKPHVELGPHFRPPHFLKLAQRRLDDWYCSINAIYLDKNYHRDAASIFTHLVEIMSGLSLLATGKKKPDVEPSSYVPKALAWWFALCGKIGIKSVEDMLWSKYPGVCPYCLERPHNQKKCQAMKKERRNPDWVALANKGRENASARPVSLCQWQQMFDSIYPAQQTEKFETVFGRFTEELGELAEAVRVAPAIPQYFVSEAADLFAWLMHLTNIIEVKEEVTLISKAEAESRTVVTMDASPLECALYREYPDRCLECGRPICACPPILRRILGRLAHEGPGGTSSLFMTSSEMSQRFDIGATELRLGDKVIPVDPVLTQEAYAVFSSILREVNLPKKYVSPPVAELRRALQGILGMLATQRLNQDMIDMTLRLLLYLEPKELATLVSSSSQQLPDGVWKQFLVGYMVPPKA